MCDILIDMDLQLYIANVIITYMLFCSVNYISVVHTHKYIYIYVVERFLKANSIEFMYTCLLICVLRLNNLFS